MLYLHGLGHFHPENVLDNAFLESLDIGTNDEWIVSRVGIHSRRTVLPLDYIRDTKNRETRLADEAAVYSNGQTGARAARMALERAGLEPGDIGMVIAGGSSPQTLIPAEASVVARELDIDVPAFDMHAACSTFGLQLHVLASQATSLPDYVLCVVPENSTRVVDFSDRSAAILFGDASAAGVVSTKHPGRAAVTYSCFGGAPAGCMDVAIPRTGYFCQNGSRVQKFAIKRMTALLKECQDRAGRDRAAELVYVGHQANFTMLQSVVKRCQVGADRHWYNIDQYGNQAAAGAPVVLSQRWKDIADGEQVAMIVVGSGLSWSTLLLQF